MHNFLKFGLQIFFLTHIYTGAFAQNIPVRTWHDSLSQTRPREQYQISPNDSLKQGAYIRYHPNGQKAMTAFFENGKKQGECIEFYPDGAKKMQTSFVNNKINGVMTNYGTSGNILQKSTFIKGKLADTSFTYFPNGILANKAFFVNDSIHGPAYQYYPSGILKQLLHYHKGRPNGMSYEYYPSGVLYIEAMYKQGLLTGTYKLYYPSGKIELESKNEQGQANGGFRRYAQNGRLIGLGAYQNGAYHGLLKAWYENGTLKKEINYKKGVPLGMAIYYAENGKKTKKTDFKIDSSQTNWEYDTATAKLILEESYKENKLVDRRKLYFADGKIKLSEQYNLYGKRINVRLVYDSLGFVRLSEPFINGIKTGIEKAYYAKKIKYYEAHVAGNRRNGLYKEFYQDKNNNLKMRGVYKNDFRHGTWTYFGTDGKQIIKEEKYKAGNKYWEKIPKPKK